jgi:hypothetical protein
MAQPTMKPAVKSVVDYDALLDTFSTEGKVTLGTLKSGQIVKQVEKLVLGKMNLKQYISKAYIIAEQYPQEIREFMAGFQQIGWQSAKRLVNGALVDPTNNGKIEVPDYQIDIYIGNKTADEIATLQKVMSKLGFFEYLSATGTAFQHEDLLHFRNRERKAPEATLDIKAGTASLESLLSDEQLD